MNLYHLDQRYREITDELVNNGGELTPELEEALTTVTTDVNTVAANFALSTIELDAREKSIDAEIKRLTEYKKSVASASTRIKEQIKAAMERLNIQKIETELVRISFRRSEETVIDDEELVPPIYKEAETKYKIIKAEIKEMIKAGGEVPGARVVVNANLQIK